MNTLSLSLIVTLGVGCSDKDPHGSNEDSNPPSDSASRNLDSGDAGDLCSFGDEVVARYEDEESELLSVWTDGCTTVATTAEGKTRVARPDSEVTDGPDVKAYGAVVQGEFGALNVESEGARFWHQWAFGDTLDSLALGPGLDAGFAVDLLISKDGSTAVATSYSGMTLKFTDLNSREQWDGWATSWVHDISADGQKVLFTSTTESGCFLKSVHEFDAVKVLDEEVLRCRMDGELDPWVWETTDAKLFVHDSELGSLDSGTSWDSSHDDEAVVWIEGSKVKLWHGGEISDLSAQLEGTDFELSWPGAPKVDTVEEGYVVTVLDRDKNHVVAIPLRF